MTEPACRHATSLECSVLLNGNFIATAINPEIASAIADALEYVKTDAEKWRNFGKHWQTREPC